MLLRVSEGVKVHHSRFVDFPDRTLAVRNGSAFVEPVVREALHRHGKAQELPRHCHTVRAEYPSNRAVVWVDPIHLCCRRVGLA